MMRKQPADWKDVPPTEADADVEPDTEREEQSPEERIIAAIDAVVGRLSEKINTDGLKIGDVVKLLQMRKELAGNRPKYVSIRWVRECDEQTPSND